MAQFSRRTILAAMDLMAEWGHAGIDRFLLEYGLEDAISGNSRANRANALAKHLIANPDALTDDGTNLSDTIVEHFVQSGIRYSTVGYPPEFDYHRFLTQYAALHRGLERDGFTLEDGQLRRTLPEAIDLPKADDEVHQLLAQYRFTLSQGHLDQGIAAHARGDWAAANGQFRPFIESLFDSTAERLGCGAVPAGNQRRIWLANCRPPFFLQDLNEWDGQGHGFIEAFFRRLHPAGAHPGLSDEEDSTFRLHMVLLVGRLLLRRIAQV
jgi:hypothetical protein